MKTPRTPSSSRAVFLDRDGVLVEDVEQVLAAESFRILPGVPESLGRLAGAGFKLAVVTNQPIVARGLATEAQVESLHQQLVRMLVEAGGPRIDGIWACPHHPHANVVTYRVACECRKPRPGLILDGARALGVTTASSWMVGDRASDIAAGRRAGCRTILVESGRHADRPIVGAENLGSDGTPHHRATDLAAAVDHILGYAG